MKLPTSNYFNNKPANINAIMPTVQTQVVPTSVQDWNSESAVIYHIYKAEAPEG